MNTVLIIARLRIAFEKLMISIINAALVIVPVFPFWYLGFEWNDLRWVCIAGFFAENLVALIYFDYRLPGMALLKRQWQKPYTLYRKMAHSVLYTLSFSTLFFWIEFPFDLFLINMLVLQWPCILLRGNTLHGCLAGDMRDKNVGC